MDTELEPEPTEGPVLAWPPVPAAAGVVVILSALLHPSGLLLHRQLVPGTVRPAGPAEDTNQERSELRATLYLHIVLALLQQEPEALVQHRPGEVAGGHLSCWLGGTGPGLVNDAGLEGGVRAAELLLGGGSHALHHLHQPAVVVPAVARDGGPLLDALGMLQVICTQYISQDPAKVGVLKRLN